MNRTPDIEDITAEWLSETLGYRVQSVTREQVGTGQTGASFRLTLDTEQGPRSLLAKVATGDPDARARVAAGYAAEVGFYTHLTHGLAIRTPACWYAAIFDDRRHFTLLLEDLAPRKPVFYWGQVDKSRWIFWRVLPAPPSRRLCSATATC